MGLINKQKMSNPFINLSSNQNPCKYILHKKTEKQNSNTNNDLYFDLTKTNSIIKNDIIDLELPQLNINNVVCSVNLGCNLNLEKIYLNLYNAKYTEGSQYLIMEIKEPKTTALITNKGKLICSGAKNEIESKKAAKKFAKIIKAFEHKVQFKNYKIINYTASKDLEFDISLNELNDFLCSKNQKSKDINGNIVNYKSKGFSGLVYHMENPKVNVLIFEFGKIVFQGAKERTDIVKALGIIYPLVNNFKKENKDNNAQVLNDFDMINSQNNL